MKNLQNVKYVLNKLVNAPVNYGKTINSNLILIEDPKLLSKYNLTNPESEVIFKLKILKEFCNIQNTLHGGALSTIVDIATTVAISGLDKHLRNNVSVELSTHFLNPIKIDSDVIVLCKIPKIGKNLTYSYADIYDESTMKLCAHATHIKAMLINTWKE